MVFLAALQDWLLFVHVLAAMAWVGGLTAVTVLGTLVLRSQDRDAIARFIGSLRVIGPILLGPAMALVLGFGIWLVVDSGEFDFGQAWIRLALALFAVAFLIGAVFQSRAAIQAGRAVEGGDPDRATRQLGRWLWGSRLILLILLVVTWDMVFKPGL